MVVVPLPLQPTAPNTRKRVQTTSGSTLALNERRLRLRGISESTKSTTPGNHSEGDRKPALAVLVAVSVRVEVAVPFAGRVTEVGENDAVTLLGNEEMLKVMGNDAVLFRLVSVMVALPELPEETAKLVGEAEIEKLLCGPKVAICIIHPYGVADCVAVAS